MQQGRLVKVLLRGGVTGLDAFTELPGTGTTVWRVNAAVEFFANHYKCWRLIGNEYYLINDLNAVDGPRGQIEDDAAVPPPALKNGDAVVTQVLLCRQ